jgi:hypothetical protein
MNIKVIRHNPWFTCALWLACAHYSSAAEPTAPAAPLPPPSRAVQSAPAASAPLPDQRAASTAAAAISLPVYVPPRRGAPLARVGGGTRAQDAPNVQLLALAPNHTGLTTSATPTLYWYLSRDMSASFEFVLTAHDSVQPLWRRRETARFARGIHRLDLADSRVMLQPGITYQWAVAIVVDALQRSKDVVGIGYLERVTPSSEATAMTSDTATLASQGLWYDALHAAIKLADSETQRSTGLAYRNALLKQAALQAALESP